MSNDLLPRRIMTESGAEIQAEPTVEATGPDKNVIVACGNFIELEVYRQELSRENISIKTEEASELRVAHSDQNFRLALDKLCQLKAVTLAGLVAKAHAALVAEPYCISDIAENSLISGRIVASILRDLLAATT